MFKLKRPNSILFLTFCFILIVFIGSLFFYFKKSLRIPIKEFIQNELQSISEKDHISEEKMKVFQEYAQDFNDHDFSALSSIVMDISKDDSERVFSVYLLGFSFHKNVVPLLKEIILKPYQAHPEDPLLDDIEISIRSFALEGLSQLARMGKIEEALSALKELENLIENPELLQVYQKALAFALGEVDDPVSIQNKKELEVLLQKENLKK